MDGNIIMNKLITFFSILAGIGLCFGLYGLLFVAYFTFGTVLFWFTLIIFTLFIAVPVFGIFLVLAEKNPKETKL